MQKSIFEIAKKSLEHNIVPLRTGPFLSAGSHQFKTFWTRDFCLSARGLLAIGRGDVVKNQVEYLLKHRRSDNLVPLYVDSMNPSLRVVTNSFFKALGLGGRSLKIKESINPYYLVNEQHEVADSNVLVLYAAWVYAETTGEREWWLKLKADFKAVFDFYQHKLQRGLINQGVHADWQDSAKRQGRIFFTNLLYYHMGQVYGFLNADELGSLKSLLIRTFFDEAARLFRSMEGRENISLEANLWAIDYNLLVDAKSLYAQLSKHPLFTQFGVPGYATYPSYRSEDMYIQVKIVGLREYHGNLFWSWLMGYSGKIAFKCGDLEMFQKIRNNLQTVLERDQTVYEIYRPQAGNPHFESYLYKSESPFSWGSAFILDMEKTAN